MKHFLDVKSREKNKFYILLFLFVFAFLHAEECALNFEIVAPFSIPMSFYEEKNTLLTKKGAEFFGSMLEFVSTKSDQELEIKMQLKDLEHPHEKIPLIQKLFKIKLKAFEDEGLSIDEFIEEARGRIKNESYQILFEGEDGEIKTEIFALYHFLLYLAWHSTELRYISSNFYPLPFLQLFHLEQETFFLLFKERLLEEEISSYAINFSLLKIYANEGKPDWWKPLWISPKVATQNYWGPGLVFFKFLLQYVDSNQCSKHLKEQAIEVAIGGYFNPKMYRLFSDVKEEYDPLTQLFPYIIKNTSIDKIKDYFYERFKFLDAWEREAFWIDLHFQAIEILASCDPNKAYDYLKKAEKEIDEKLWAYFFSPNYAAWQKEREKALVRLNEWKAKMKPTAL